MEEGSDNNENDGGLSMAMETMEDGSGGDGDMDEDFRRWKEERFGSIPEGMDEGVSLASFSVSNLFWRTRSDGKNTRSEF